jgi:hypothetical protein
MRVSLACLFVFLACLSALPGCTQRRPAEEGASDRSADAMEQPAEAGRSVDLDSFPMQAVSNDGSYLVACRPRPDPVPFNEPFELDLVVLRPDTRTPVVDAQVFVDADMPEHRHGMNTRALVRRNADGSLSVSGMHFFMAGYWEIYVDIERDGVVERAQFGLTLD